MKLLNKKNLYFIKSNIVLILFVILGIFFFTAIASKNIISYFKNFREGLDIVSIPPENEQQVSLPLSTNTQTTSVVTTSSGTNASGSSASGTNASGAGTNASAETIENSLIRQRISSDMSIFLEFDVNDVKDGYLANKFNGTQNFNVKMNGTPQIITTDTAVANSCLSLSNNSYLSIDNFSVTTQGFSVMFWAKTTTSEWKRIFDFGNGEDNDNILFSVEHGPIVLNKVNGSVYGFNPDYSDKISDGRWKLNNGKWNQVVWTCTYAPTNSLTSTWHIYVNNKMVYKTDRGLYPNTNSNRTKNYIGKSNWREDDQYTGLIDRFKVFNKVLNAEDVNFMYNNKGPNVTS